MNGVYSSLKSGDTKAFSLCGQIRPFFSNLIHRIAHIFERMFNFLTNLFTTKTNLSSRVFVYEKLEAPNGYQQKLQNELEALVAKSLSQSGCLQYDLMQDKENPSKFSVWMCFRDHQAYLDHTNSDFIADFERRLGDTHYKNVEEYLYHRL